MKPYICITSHLTIFCNSQGLFIIMLSMEAIVAGNTMRGHRTLHCTHSVFRYLTFEPTSHASSSCCFVLHRRVVIRNSILEWQKSCSDLNTLFCNEFNKDQILWNLSIPRQLFIMIPTIHLVAYVCNKVYTIWNVVIENANCKIVRRSSDSQKPCSKDQDGHWLNSSKKIYKNWWQMPGKSL